MFCGRHYNVSTMQGGTTPILNVFGMTGPSSNRESNPQILLVSARSPYRRLLRSAGATEDLFVTRVLHQEAPPRIPTGCSGNSWQRPKLQNFQRKSTPGPPLNAILDQTLDLRIFTSPKVGNTAITEPLLRQMNTF